jgi:hypothetical protein
MDHELMHRVAVLLFVLLAAGCTNQLAVRQAQLQQLVGRPEMDLIQVMGVPTRTYETGGTKFLSYEERQTEFIPGSPYYYAPGPFPGFWGGPYGGGFPPQAVNLACDTTFAVAGGVVRSFTLRGNACG